MVEKNIAQVQLVQVQLYECFFCVFFGKHLRNKKVRNYLIAAINH